MVYGVWWGVGVYHTPVKKFGTHRANPAPHTHTKAQPRMQTYTHTHTHTHTCITEIFVCRTTQRNSTNPAPHTHTKAHTHMSTHTPTHPNMDTHTHLHDWKFCKGGCRFDIFGIQICEPPKNSFIWAIWLVCVLLKSYNTCVCQNVFCGSRTLRVYVRMCAVEVV